jgi:hypothetical protein
VAGFSSPALPRLTATKPPANTANPQAAVMEMIPPPLPPVFLRRILATTPFPKRIRNIVPIISAIKIVDIINNDIIV